MKQFNFFIDLNKEEDYLNQMAGQGWLLKKRSIIGTYNFIKDIPKKLHYKIDYRTFKNKKDFDSYVLLFEDAGFKHIWGDRYSGRQYFLSDNREACSEIFSDIQSKAQLYIRLQKNCVFSFIMMLAYMMINFISVDFVLSDLFFLTPGLWEMQGAKFWEAFWFEFPFMLMRVVPVIIFAVAAIVNFYLALKAKAIYKKIIAEEENESI